MQQFGLKENEIKALCAVFASIPEVEEAVVYGSRARMTNRISSDIDITLIGKDLTYTQLALADDMIDSLFLPYFIILFLELFCINLIFNSFYFNIFVLFL